MVSIKKIFPIEFNLELKNMKEYLKPSNIKIETVDNSPRVFLLDAASYNNLGDQAITYATSVFLTDLYGKDNFYEITERDLLRNIKYLKKIICHDDIICLSGGGNMGTLYPRYEALRRKVIKTFPNNKIIIFPQTIDYEEDTYGKKELRRSKQIYNQHDHIFICAREKKSYEIMKNLYKNVIFVPDITLYLKGKLIYKTDLKKENVGICLRDDKESIVSEEFSESIRAALQKLHLVSNNLTTISDSKQMIVSDADRQLAIMNKLREFSSYKFIITDRLHGMIFSVLAGVPCIAIDNSNKKVFGVMEMLKEAGYNVVCISDDRKIELESLFKSVENLSNKDVTMQNFDYSNLVDIIIQG